MQDHSDHTALQACLQLIEKKLGWGKAAQWHNGEFGELSERIQQDTGVLLSQTTLKRVWGRVTYTSAPSMTTLNALAQFAGFAHWRDFVQSNSKPAAGQKNRKSIPKWIIAAPIIALFVVLLTSLFSMIGPSHKNAPAWEADHITFSSKPIAEGLPNTVVFDYELAGYRSDSMQIQQYWDPTKTIPLKAGQQQATGIYYFPGYFRAKLILDGQIVKEHDLFIKSQGWMATLNYQPVPKYLSTPAVFDGKLHLPASMIAEVASAENPLRSVFHFVDELGDVSGDHFSLSTSVKNRYREKWAVCQHTKIIIIGTEGAFAIPFSIPGCVSDLNLMLNDVYLDGKEHDLSALGVDFTETRNIDISVQDKLVQISVDGKAIFQQAYHESIGRLVGLRYRFVGAGEVSGLEVRDGQGRVIEKLGF